MFYSIGVTTVFCKYRLQACKYRAKVLYSIGYRSTNWLVWMSSITTYSLLVMSSFTRYLKLTYSSFSHAMKLSLQRKFSLIRYFFLPSLLWISRCVRFLFTNCWCHGLLGLFWSVSVFETLSLYCLTSIQSPVETFLASSFYFAVY